MGLDVDRAQRLGQRRQRLHRRPHDQRLPVGHAALEATGAVGLAVVAALGRVEDLVVGLRAGQPGQREAITDRDALDRLDRADRHRQAAVEALLPGDVRAHAREQPEGLHLEDPAERLVGPAQLVDLAHHRPRASASRQRTGELVDVGEVLGRERRWVPGPAPRRSGSRASGSRRRARAGMPCSSAPPATRAAVSRAEARSRMLRTSLCLYFCVPTRSAWPGRGRWTSSTSSVHRPWAHPLLPVGVVAVGICSATGPPSVRPWRTPPVTCGAVALDLHPPTAAVTELATGHVAVDLLLGAARGRPEAPRRCRSGRARATRRR